MSFSCRCSIGARFPAMFNICQNPTISEPSFFQRGIAFGRRSELYQFLQLFYAAAS
jgi:hypothetical protein